MKTHLFLLKITRDEWLRYYRGHANKIKITSLQGLKITISAHHFRSHTTETGVIGFFRLTLGTGNRFISLEKLG
jgi:hypothetical protein